jgi:hypothetical protein
MYNDTPEAGLASLLASRGRGGDSVLVHMAPQELAGLQQLAMAHGGSLTRNPETGLYEASFLKKILPQVIGAILPSVPGVGQFTKTLGFGNEALGSALIVGGATGLIEGDLKKGLMAGLGAYSGASIAGGLKAAAGVGAPAGAEAEVPTSQVSTGAAGASFAPPSVKDQILSGGTAPRGFDIDATRAKNWAASNTPVGAAPIQAATTVKPPTSFLGTMGQGVKNILTTPEGASKFMEGLGGGYKSPIGQTLSRYAAFSGAMLPFTEEPKAFPTGGAGGDEIVYIPGKYDPSNTSVFQAQGQYYRRTPQGMVPINPWAAAPKGRGFATGGPVQPEDQNMNQERSIPHQNAPFPYPNQSYPLSTVTGTPYPAMQMSGTPQPREIIGNYEPDVDVFTGEQRFADGGAVAEDPKILATRSYIEELNRRARNPYGGPATSGIGGGLSAFGPQYLPPATGGDSGAGTGAVKQPGIGDIVGGIAANYLVNKGIESGIGYLKDKFGNKQPEGQIQDSLEGVDLSALPATTAALTQLNPPNVPPRQFNVDVEQVPDVEPPATTTPAAAQPSATSSIPLTTGSLAALSAASPFMNISPLPPTRTVIEPVSYEGEEMVVREDMTPAETARAAQAATTPATSAIPYSAALSAISPFAATAPSAIPVVGEPVYDALGNVSGFKYPDGTIEPVEGYTREPGQLDADLQAKTRVGGDMSAPLSSYLSGASSVGAGLAGLASGSKYLTSIIPIDPLTGVAQTLVSPAASAATGAASGAGAAGTGAAGAGAGTSTLTGKVIPGLQAALGLYEAYKGIEAGKEGRAALGGFGAGAGIATLAGATPGFGALAAAGPIGLAAAAIAAIGASMVNTKEQGDVALRNYWKAVDQGRGLGSAPPEELAEGFINFYRTNKNNFAGQEAYGRKGNEDFVYDMTQVVNKAVKDGTVPKDATAEEIYQKAVQPWLSSLGSGPQDADAKRIQDFMMTDMIYNFMQGKPISNAQVKGDKNFKIVSEKPVFAGSAPPIVGQMEQAREQALTRGVDGRALAEFLGSRGEGIPAAISPFAEKAVPVNRAVPTEEPVGPPPLSLPEEPVGPTPLSLPEDYGDRTSGPQIDWFNLWTQKSKMSPDRYEEYVQRMAPMSGMSVAEYRAYLDDAAARSAAEDAYRQSPEGRAANQAFQQELNRPGRVSLQSSVPVEALTPLPEEPYYAPEPAYLDSYNPYAAALPYERMNRFAGGGAIGDDFNFGFAHGGMPEYKAGGKLLEGPGDGMSDDIPAVIRGKGVQRAALADGEFVVPADVVSHLGNGSTKAGAKKLYDMMARIREARTGKTRQAPEVKTERYMPA